MACNFGVAVDFPVGSQGNKVQYNIEKIDKEAVESEL